MSSSVEDRLKILPAPRLGSVSLHPAMQPAWPSLDGQLTIVFTSRVGSSFLCRHIQKTRAVSQVGEAFNKKPLETLRIRHQLVSIEDALAERMNASIECGWFVAKAGPLGLAVAEHVGHMHRYLPVTRFWLLLRRDLAAQAVSMATAKLSGQFHSTQPAGRILAVEEYDETLLLGHMRTIVRGCDTLRRYLEAADRPTRALCYEDFVDGDFGKVDIMLDALGLPVRLQPPVRPQRDVHPVTRNISADWRDRLRRAPDARDILDRYDQMVEQSLERYC